MKKLKLWNGRIYHPDKRNLQYVNSEDSVKRKLAMWTHCYVCATSVKHVIELAHASGIAGVSASEINVYWSKGCWGIAMNGVTPEIGIWADHGIWGEKPTRLI